MGGDQTRDVEVVPAGAGTSYPFLTASRIFHVPYGEVLRLDAEMPEMSAHLMMKPSMHAVIWAREQEAKRRAAIARKDSEK